MNKEVLILIVCSAGAGSSQLLRLNLEKVIKELGLDNIKTEVSDIGTFKSIACDAIISSEYNSQIVKDHHTAKSFVAVKGIFDFREIREKLLDLLAEIGYPVSEDGLPSPE